MEIIIIEGYGIAQISCYSGFLSAYVLRMDRVDFYRHEGLESHAFL